MIALRISRLEHLDDVGVDIDDESKQKTCDRGRWIEFDVMRKANNHIHNSRLSWVGKNLLQVSLFRASTSIFARRISEGI